MKRTRKHSGHNIRGANLLELLAQLIDIRIFLLDLGVQLRDSTFLKTNQSVLLSFRLGLLGDRRSASRTCSVLTGLRGTQSVSVNDIK